VVERGRALERIEQLLARGNGKGEGGADLDVGCDRSTISGRSLLKPGNS
jgi:hypothetical protein